MTTQDKDAFPIWMIFIIIMFGVIVLGAIIFITISLCSKPYTIT
jgi:hypothetical protein